MEWTGARYADKPTVEVSTWVAAPPERVWALVSDGGLMPWLSDELQSVEWLGDASGPAAGARFVGRSKQGALGEWATTSHLVEYEPCRLFGWAVTDPERPSARWRFRVEPEDGGTRLSEWMQLGPGRSGLSFAMTGCPTRNRRSSSCACASSSATSPRPVERLKTLAEA